LEDPGGGDWFLANDRTNNSSLIEKGAEPQSGTTNCLKRQDALQAFIRKYLFISKKLLLQDLI